MPSLAARKNGVSGSSGPAPASISLAVSANPTFRERAAEDTY